MEQWKNDRKQPPSGTASEASVKRTERLVAELRANLVKRKAAARGRDGERGRPATTKDGGQE